MKVTHSNQTLILASERRGQGAKPDNTLDRAVNAASKGGALKRVTIVAAQSKGGQDTDFVYVRADYSERRRGANTAAPPDPDTGRRRGTLGEATNTQVAPPGTALIAAPRSLPRTASGSNAIGEWLPSSGSNDRDLHGNLQAEGRGGLSAYLKPEELYARTQRISTSAPLPSLIDVLA